MIVVFYVFTALHVLLASKLQRLWLQITSLLLFYEFTKLNHFYKQLKFWSLGGHERMKNSGQKLHRFRSDFDYNTILSHVKHKFPSISFQNFLFSSKFTRQNGTISLVNWHFWWRSNFRKLLKVAPKNRSRQTSNIFV